MEIMESDIALFFLSVTLFALGLIVAYSAYTVYTITGIMKRQKGYKREDHGDSN